MKRGLLVVSILLISSGLAFSDITNVTCASDGDGVITCTSGWTYDDETHTAATLDIDGVHHWIPAEGLAGHILGDVTTDSENDPSLTVVNIIDNDTYFPWTDYHINIYMTKTFTLSNLLGPDNWDVDATTAALQVGGEHNGEYLATIDYVMDPEEGDPILIGGTGEFRYKMTFVGAASYCQELIPTPEPMSSALLGSGVLALLARRRRKAG